LNLGHVGPLLELCSSIAFSPETNPNVKTLRGNNSIPRLRSVATRCQAVDSVIETLHRLATGGYGSRIIY
jgi:hypothetical protein